MLTKDKSGFTLVELMVVIVIIAILAAIAVVSYNSIQQRSRDSVRSTKLYAIASALEDYYQDNGEYPGCPAMTADGSVVIKNTLTNLGTSDALVTPLAAAGTTNSITCASLSSVPTSTDAFVYTGDTSTDCSSGAACLSWTLQIRTEDSDVLKATSRHVATP